MSSCVKFVGEDANAHAIMVDLYDIMDLGTKAKRVQEAFPRGQVIGIK